MADQTVLIPQAQSGQEKIEVPTQAYRTQLDLGNISAAQTRLNMEVGAQLDRYNATYFAGEDIRRTQAAGTESRLNISAQGIENRNTISRQAQEERDTLLTRYAGEKGLAQEQGNQARLTQAERYAGEETLIGKSGLEQRANIGKTGLEERLTQAERYTGERGLITESGSEQRTTIGVQAAEERETVGKSAEEQRETIGKSATEQRTTDLQQEMFRRYKENRDYEQAQNQYRT